MEYITLYRKYRPKNFAELYGQEYISKSLKNAIKLDKISHAYIFCGSHGIGKTSIAKIFAKSLNCLHPVDGDACCQCDNCKLFDSNTTDIIELDAASNNGVDNVRELISSINYQPTTLKKKVYIIDEVHMLTTAG
ncbi:hypothetical protein FACS189459_4540 [Bacilli bacterium]|nr:hypothetical protein FACS189459_4540 [Bacilli bacterium]